MSTERFLTIDSPDLPVIGDVGTSGLPVAEYVDITEENQQFVNAAGIVTGTRDMFLPNFSFRVFEGQMHRDAVLKTEEEKGGEFVGSCIFMESKLYSYAPGVEQPIATFNRSHNFKYDPHHEIRHFIPAQSKIDYVHFAYKAEFLNEILPADEKWADRIREHLDKRIMLIGNEARRLNPSQENALRNIFDCPLQGKWAVMMIESSFAQLIYHQMHALFNDEDVTYSKGFNKKDLDTMLELRDYLSNGFLEDHSMVGLARQFGTNTNKLMTQFKKLFGKSIFEYLTELRMEYASKLLRDNKMRVTEVAHILKYKNPNHFSAAFKRHFGTIPSEFRAA